MPLINARHIATQAGSGCQAEVLHTCAAKRRKTDALECIQGWPIRQTKILYRINSPSYFAVFTLRLPYSLTHFCASYLPYFSPYWPTLVIYDATDAAETALA
eukprot:1176337-Prorocentrum_minimum.AAC.1